MCNFSMNCDKEKGTTEADSHERRKIHKTEADKNVM